MSESTKDLDAQIKEAQINIAWAEHKGQQQERRKWVEKLRELKMQDKKGQ